MASNAVDVAFVSRLHAGDETLFADLVYAHGASVERYCRHFANGVEEQHDLAQSTWLAAWTNRQQFSGSGSFAGWLHRLARTTCLRAVRQRGEMIPIESVPEFCSPPAPDEAALLHLQDLEDEQLSRVMNLPRRQRAVVLYRLCVGLSTDQTAEALGCRPGTVKASLHKAIKSLRQSNAESVG